MDEMLTSRAVPLLSLVLVARMSDVLKGLLGNTAGVMSATVATADGFTAASTISHREESNRMAAMSSSMAALAAALAREVRRGEPERIIVDTADGHIVSMTVPQSSPPLVLTVVTDKSAALGTFLWSCRSAADAIGQACADTAPSAANALSMG